MTADNIAERVAILETKAETLNEKVDDIKTKLNDIDIFLRNRLINEIHEMKANKRNKIKEYGVYGSLFLSTLSIITLVAVHIL